MEMKTNELITKSDLEAFGQNMIAEIRRLFDENNTATKKWLKTSEVLNLLKISPGKLQTMRNSRIITFTRIGGSLYYDPVEIQNMFEKNKVRS